MIYRTNTPAINLANANEVAAILGSNYSVVELEPGAYKVVVNSIITRKYQ